nr:type II secretion system minor pseudopilin GspJ [Acinetobacter sp. Marseille-Q1620]
MSKNISRKYTAGFTLVELLVAIAIFAILSALGWKIFDYLMKVKDRNAMHEQNLGELQEAYQQMQRDMLQIIPLSANMGGQVQPALLLNDQRLAFSKTGVTDPLKQGLSPYERIEYRYDAQEKKLYRLKYPNLNVTNLTQPQASVVLKNIEQYQVSILTPEEIDQWPDASVDLNNKNAIQLLPKGVRIRVKVQDIEYEWIFSLLDTELLKILNLQGASDTSSSEASAVKSNNDNTQQNNSEN